MLKAGDTVYAIDAWGNKFEIETAVVEKITPKLIFLTDGKEPNRRSPGLAFGCQRQWPIGTKFSLTPTQACNEWIKKEQDNILYLQKEVVKKEASITKMFNFRAGLKK